MDKTNRRRALKLRFRRRFRLQRKQVEEFGAQAEQRLDTDLFKRLERLVPVRRFVFTWLLLVVLLIAAVVAQTRALRGYYQELTPIPGGTFTEGILGSFTNANPLYASDLVDSSVAELVFAGLFSYDQNNQLTGDLADALNVDEAGTTYTVHLRPNLTWHDGQPLTADDVVFTYQVIQNPDAQSPLYNNWQGVTITAVDARTISFKLPNPLASFPYSLTNGIVPKHLLGDVAMIDMRSQAFNTTEPVGAGPFKWQAIELIGGSSDTREERIALQAFDAYRGGEPKLNGFVVRTFRSETELAKSLAGQEINAAVGLLRVPDELKGDPTLRVYNLPLTAEVMVFFKNSLPVFSDAAVRLGLVQAIDTVGIIRGLEYPTLPVREPLLPGQLAYDGAYRQAGYDQKAAGETLQAAGWVVGTDGLRRKGDALLSFQLFAQVNGEYGRIAEELVRQWRAVGVDAKLVPQDDATFQNTLSLHSYEAVIYGISIGVDPDVYPYWHSSQADVRAPVRLNFSEYRSAKADAALEDGRTRLAPDLRAAKYQPFLQAWQADNPALGLYRPRFLYLSRGAVHGLEDHPVNADAERFTNVQNWQIREAYQTPRD